MMLATRSKRFLAMLLALIMCLSTLPVGVFASGYSNQVADGYFTVDAEGNATYYGDEIPNVTQDGYTVSKNISQTGKNAFDITLKVETSQTVKTNDAAVILVIDTSGSMDYCAECGAESWHKDSCKYRGQVYDNQTRMAAAISAAKDFIDSLKENNKGGSIYVSVVGFESTAFKVCDWMDITQGNNATAVKNRIGQLEADGGTNLEAGMLLARNRLDMSAIASASDKYTVLLTDGQPTFRVTTDSDKVTSTSYAGNGYSDAGKNTSDNYGSACSKAERSEAVEAAGEVKERSTLYTICFGAEDSTVLNGERIEVCEHCGLTRDKHEKVTLCENCGKSFDEHEWVGYGFHGYWKCPDRNDSYDGETYRLCADGQKYKATWQESGTLTVGSFLDNEIATSSDYAYNAKDTDKLNAAFADIASSVSEGSSGAGTQVVDPMGRFINFSAVTYCKGGTASFDEDNNTLIWTLDPDKAETSTSGGTTTYKFTLTYSITLDTAAQGFQETEEVNGKVVTKNYPTNGYTRLTVPGEDDIAFNVPGVFGTIPEYGYRVEYYKQNQDGNGYTLVDTENGPDTDLHTSVTILDEDEEVPANIKNKYASGNYHFAKADPASITISANESANVIKVYYDRDTTSVTVNHYYKTDIYAADGTFTEGQYTNQPQAVKTDDEVYVGDSYTAQEAPTYASAQYELDSEMENEKTIDSLSAEAGENVINLYYTRTVDERADASVVVNHVYRTHTWTLENGKYVLKTTTQNENNVESSTGLKATTVYTAKTDPAKDFVGFTYNASESTNSITLQAGENVITLYFDKTVDERVPVSLTVNHHYTKTVVTIGPDGQPVTTVNPDNHVEPMSVNAYKGETVTVSEQNTYDGDIYTSDTGNAAKLTLTNVQGGESVDLYYTIYQAPETTSVTVKHIYRTITHETVVTTDDEGNVTGTKVVDSTNVDEIVSEVANNLYVGQSYTAAQKSREGYTFNESDSNGLTATVEADGKTVINLYYDKDEDKDDRDAANITVQHVYTTHLTTIVNGEVETIDVPDGTETEPTRNGKAGDPFAAVPETSYNGNEYTVMGDPDLDVILQSGTNDTIVINYERSASDLVETTYTVNYVYNTYTMVVENGVAKYGEPAVEPVNGTAQNGYVGQIVTISDGAREGFTAANDNPATEQTLKDGENVYTFVYNKYVPLGKVSVTVNHHYTTTTIAVNGTSSSSTSDVLGSPVAKYVGEDYVARAVPNGFTYNSYTVTENIVNTQDEATKNVTVTASGDVVVDFYYSKTVDNSKSVTYTIRHIYKTIDWNGSVSEDEGTPITGNSYATLPLSANVDDNGGNYTLKDATFNGSAISDFDPDDPQETYQVILVDGTNEIIYTYERRVDTREETTVQVTYNYFARDTYTDDDAMTDAEYIAQEGMAPEYSVVKTVTGKANGVWVGSSYTAADEPNYTAGEGADAITLTYAFVSASPEGGKVDSLLALDNGNIPDGNKIVMNYIRQYTTDPGDTTYTVNHVYRTNGSETGTYQTSGTGKVNATVNASDIAKVTAYDGNTYSYTSASADSITLVADAASNTITLYYDRTISDPGPGPGPGTTTYTITVNYYNQDGDKIAESHRESHNSGTQYDVSAYDAIAIEGYTYVETTGDAVSGILNSNKVIDVYYTNEADIDDGDTPLNPNPDDGGEIDIDDGETPMDDGSGLDDGTEIIDPETPLGNLPQTGAAEAVNPFATAGFMALAASMAAAGLVLTRTKSGKREED